MKCRRSSTSPGARLRGPRAGAASPNPGNHPKSGTADLPPANARALPGSEANLRLDVRTAGPIHHAGTLTIGPNAAVLGNVYATTVVVEGEIIGDIHAAQGLRIAASACVRGDIHTPQVSIARGARLSASISMHAARPAASDLDERGVDGLLSGSRHR